MTALRPHVSNPKALAAQYRLSLTPTREPKVKVGRCKKSLTGTNDSNGADVAKVPEVQYRFWLLDDDPGDFDFEDPEDDELESTGTGDGLEESQKAYAHACRELQVTPITRFSRSLLTSSVSMINQRLPLAQTRAMAAALTRNSAVEKLHLEANELGVEGARILAEIIPSKNDLTELCLVNNNLGRKGAKMISHALQGSTTVRKLDLSGNNFDETAAPYFRDLLQESISLRDVNLSHNSFREKGGVILASGIANNDFLSRLDLSWNNLRMEGASAIGDSLKVNHILEVVNLGWNGFHLRGCKALGEALEGNHSLVELDLSCNRINPICLAQLLKNIAHNATLKVLKLPLNPLYPEGAMSILKLLQKFKDLTLQEIDLGRQSVFEEFVELLAELQQKRRLKVIYGEVLRGPFELKLPEKVEEEEEEKEPERPKTVEELIDENPMLVLMEFMRQQNLRLVDVFTILDSDRDCTVTREEFKNGLQSVGIPLTTTALDNLLDALDRNKKGDVDLGELTAAHEDYRKKLHQAMARDDYETSEYVRIGSRVHAIMKKRFVMRQW